MSPAGLIFVFGICTAQAALIDLSGVKAQVNEDKYACQPACGEGQCCTHYYSPIHGGKRAKDTENQVNPLQSSQWPGLIKRCQALKQKGEKCLTRNPGEWCPCKSGLSCKAGGTTGLDAYFGTCV